MRGKTRADRIYEVLRAAGGRLHYLEIHKRICVLEGGGPDAVRPSTISATVRQDNRTRRARGRPVRFKTSGDGTEVPGYVSLRRDLHIQLGGSEAMEKR